MSSKVIIITSITKLYSTSTPQTYKTYLSTGYRSNCRPYRVQICANLSTDMYRLLGDQPTTMKLERPTLMKKNNRWIQSGFQHVTPILNSSKSGVIIAGIRPETNAPTSLVEQPRLDFTIVLQRMQLLSLALSEHWDSFFSNGLSRMITFWYTQPFIDIYPKFWCYTPFLCQTQLVISIHPKQNQIIVPKAGKRMTKNMPKNPCWLTGILHYISITFNNSLERTYHGEYICIYTYR